MTDRTEPTNREHGVIVVFDVTAPDNRTAAEVAVQALVDADLVTGGGGPRIESWWLAEGEVKDIDRNDNADMTLVRRNRLRDLVGTYIDGDGEAVEAIIRSLAEQIHHPAL